MTAVGSNSLASPATRTDSDDASKRRIALTPLRPSTSPDSNASAPTPNGDTMPIPTIATRRRPFSPMNRL